MTKTYTKEGDKVKITETITKDESVTKAELEARIAHLTNSIANAEAQIEQARNVKAVMEADLVEVNSLLAQA